MVASTTEGGTTVLEGFNAALDLAEGALRTGAPVDVTAMARQAGTSEHHFRRTFSTLSGMPLGESLRRRRQTLAAADVLSGELSVLDVAVRHGYGSAEAFTRAFRAVHGVGPSQVRQDRSPLVSQPRVSFHLIVEGSSSMEYRIVDKPAFHVVGVRSRVPLVHLGPNRALEEFVASIDPDVTGLIETLSDQEPSGVVSVTDGLADTREEGSELDYWHAAVTSREAPEGLEELSVPAGAWVVLDRPGLTHPEGLQLLWREAYAEWFPANPWRTRPGPELLRTAWHEDGTVDGELWLPVEPQPR